MLSELQSGIPVPVLSIGISCIALLEWLRFFSIPPQTVMTPSAVFFWFPFPDNGLDGSFSMKFSIC